MTGTLVIPTAAERLAAEVAHGAPGIAGAAERWAHGFGDVPAAGPVPELWRIGEGAPLHDPADVFPVAVPLLDHAHLWVMSNPGGPATRVAAEALVETLALRVLRYFRPGLVRLHVWDIARYAGSLPGLYYPLTRAQLMDSYHPDRLADLLEELSEYIRHVNERLLTGERPTLAELAAETGERAQPWRVAVLLGDGRALPPAVVRDLQRVMVDGLACGICVVAVDMPMDVAGLPVEVVQWTDGGCRSSMTLGHVGVRPDLPPTRAAAAGCAAAVAAEFERLRAQVRDFRDLLPPPEQWGTFDSRAGLSAPIAFDEGKPAWITLDDHTPHALIGGPSGTGKTNLLLAMIAAWSVRYGPDQLEWYLLDFKESVGFAQFAPSRRDPTWLPQARLVGVDVNDDREFGLALLRHLSQVMRERGAVFREYGVAKIEELRNDEQAQADGVQMPRVVAVIDEFQYLFAANDGLAREAADLLEDIARRGRSAGIHLVIASQNVASIQAFWTRPACFEQFVLRIALPTAQRVLALLNDAADDLPRYHAIVNHESGQPAGNVTVRMPDASHGVVAQLQRILHERYPGPAPRAFDGKQVPDPGVLVASAAPGAVVLGQRMSLSGEPAVARLPARAGRNVAVVAHNEDDAVAVLSAAAASLAYRQPPGTARFVVGPFTADLDPVVWRSPMGPQHVETVPLAGYSAFLQKLEVEVFERQTSGERTPVYLILLGVDSELLSSGARYSEQTVLRLGPRVGVHVIGWWESPDRVQESFKGEASLDDLGVVVAVDAQGPGLPRLFGQTLLEWSPRVGRALWRDATVHAAAPGEVVLVPGGLG